MMSSNVVVLLTIGITTRPPLIDLIDCRSNPSSADSCGPAVRGRTTFVGGLDLCDAQAARACALVLCVLWMLACDASTIVHCCGSFIDISTRLASQAATVNSSAATMPTRPLENCPPAVIIRQPPDQPFRSNGLTSDPGNTPSPSVEDFPLHALHGRRYTPAKQTPEIPTAATRGSTVSCGKAACPPFPVITTRNSSTAAKTAPGDV